MSVSSGDSPESASTALADPPPVAKPTGRRAVPPAPPAVRTRRCPGVLAAGVALVAVGALRAAYLAQVIGQTISVVAIARDVGAGDIIERSDLTIANVSSDPPLSPIPAADLRSPRR
jgi:hypothetical protein